MNENDKKIIRILSVVIVFMFAASCAICYFIGRAHTANSTGTGDYSNREREMLDRFREYTDRESDRVDAERNRLATEGELNQRETDRIDAEGSRLERDKNSTGALRELDRRSSDLYTKLKEEIESMANY
jgi:hypothetical protein